MATKSISVRTAGKPPVQGDFMSIDGERFYAIRNVDQISPFLISIISDVDHWLFVSSTGGLTAGRVSPDTALFPYITVDKVHESYLHTGCKTVFRIDVGKGQQLWEPFNREHNGRYTVNRHLYKNLLGNKLCFEEVNHELQLAFRYTWVTSNDYGFVRQCELENLADRTARVDMIDGFQNLLPAGTPRLSQTNTSNLVDAYKWNELDEPTGLACFTLYSKISDRAEPSESLKANTVFSLGIEEPTILLSNQQLEAFRNGADPEQEAHKRGIRGAYLVNTSFALPPREPQAPKASRHWQLVADIEQSQADVVRLRRQLARPAQVAGAISESVSRGSDNLARIMASADGFQSAAEETVTVHHYANVLFNVLRGGIFDDQYNVSSWDFYCTIGQFNKTVQERNREMLLNLPDTLTYGELLSAVEQQGDPQLERLCHEYLPIRFGRRHGDPSRPWNHFTIKLQDAAGNRLLSYEGNWRDIFQNWEALALSFPEFIENMIAKFVNASTMDGYNPYRITKEGIDWEVEEPDNPWSYIGYWGDHQIIYLQKLLELSHAFHPRRLGELLRKPVFCYANVPYRIKPFESLLDDPKNTVEYDGDLAARIDAKWEKWGADAKLVLDGSGQVYQVNLAEKLLVPLLAKLGNLVIDGGIWMNTQRPEWNDANNALVGHGLSMVTLCYLRRYVSHLRELLAAEKAPISLSGEVCTWLIDTADALAETRQILDAGPVNGKHRFAILQKLGEASGRYRETVYRQEGFSELVTQPLEPVIGMLDDALFAIDRSITSNRRDDGLYNAYNLLGVENDSISIDTLYPMLEGQVAALSAGAIEPDEAAAVVEALFASNVYREDQQSFMLYPDRKLPAFLEKNRIPPERVTAIPLARRMLEDGDTRILLEDDEGCLRFNADFTNVCDLSARLDEVIDHYGDDVEKARKPLQDLYEDVFDHQAFTGRSGTMFGFEGLGSIYWHMVSKLLLAVQENFFRAASAGDNSGTVEHLGKLYYRVRKGIGFNKTPAEYGAFPMDPYSHTPKHAGARQPGMTGQVKEEVLTRFGELGVRVSGGQTRFEPALLRRREFAAAPANLQYLDIDDEWQDLVVPAPGLAFTWCQVPVTYTLDDGAAPSLKMTFDDGSEEVRNDLTLPAEASAALFERSGRIRKIGITFGSDLLFGD